MGRTPSAEHKQAMQRGRKLAAAVDAYLKALKEPRRPGRPVSLDQLRRRLADAQREVEDAEGVSRLKLVQRARDLEAKLAEAERVGSIDLPALEAAFVEVAAEYSEAHGIECATWRDAGVSPAVLKAAGIGRARASR